MRAIELAERRAAAGGRGKKPKKKASRWKIGGIGVAAVLVLGLLVFVAMREPQGTPMLGVCKTFVERYVPFPTTLRYQFIEQYPRSVRVGYSHVDTFGQFRLDMTECGFKVDPERGAMMASVLVNREDLDPEIVEAFNVGIPSIVQNLPDLTLLPPLPDDLLALKHD